MAAASEGPAAPPGRKWGPGAVVAAAFIGPGTVTACTLAGAGYGYTLLWALAFSVAATLVLQEMAARLGLVSGSGLGEAIRGRFRGLARLVAVGLVLSAIGVGNAAYETGNLLGAALGVEAVTGGSVRALAVAAGAIAAVLLWTGSYHLLERVLIALVILMSVVFVATAASLAPDPRALASGLFRPRIPGEGPQGILLVVGLIGTTVVPYNLFLHAAAVREKWAGEESLREARWDLGVSVLLGGLVSMAVVVTAAGAAAAGGPGNPASAAEMATQLEPVLGAGARYLFGIGLAAAGLTSGITAPLAAAYATAGALGWPRDLRDWRLRCVWAIVIATGVGFAAVGTRPVEAILFAQVANGLLLPGIAVFLVVMANDAGLMGSRRNGPLANLVAGSVVLVAVALGARAIWAAIFV